MIALTWLIEGIISHQLILLLLFSTSRHNGLWFFFSLIFFLPEHFFLFRRQNILYSVNNLTQARAKNY